MGSLKGEKKRDKVVSLAKRREKQLAINRRKKIQSVGTLIPMLESLRQFVENSAAAPKIALRGHTYKAIDNKVVHTCKHEGFEYGYKVNDNGMSFRRKIFVKCLDAKLSEIPEEEADRIFFTVLEVFIDRGENIPEINQIGIDTILIEQDFMPLLLKKVE